MNFRRMFLGAALAAAAVALPLRAAVAAELDIKRLAVPDAHVVLYGKANPERDYQYQYLADAWQTFRDERIAERIYDMIARQAPKEKLEEVKARWEEVHEAVEALDLNALVKGEEFVMSSVMDGPFGHNLVAVRMTEKDATECRAGVERLLNVFAKWSDGKVTVENKDWTGAQVTTLRLPKEAPFSPAVACLGDLLVFSSSETLLERSLTQLQDESAKSKFDDERLVAALKSLPEPEDMLSFFDAQQLFEGLKGLPDFVRKQSEDHDNKEDAERVANFFDLMLNEAAIIDYEVCVEYTAGGQNRSAAIGKAADDIESKLLGRAVSGGEPFVDWQTWVPVDATAYSLGTGINLHEIYVGVVQYLRDEVPEAHDGLNEWDALQKKVGVDLGADILQPFSGEYVSITLPAQQSVSALRCNNPDKIRELLDRAIDGLKQIPMVAAQELDLVDCDDEALEGFQELKASMLAATPAKPVIGFHDGWMIMASSPDAAKTFLAVRAGEGESIKDSESLERFDLKTDGKVYSVSYSDVGAGIREFADGIDHFAMMAPMIMAAATAEAPPEVRKTITEALGLLPSFSKVIRKFDFFEQKLSITREGPREGMYLREGVTLIRQPDESDSQ